MNERKEELLKELDSINKEHYSLEKTLEKIENEGVFDEDIYSKLDDLEERKYMIEQELEQLEE